MRDDAVLRRALPLGRGLGPLGSEKLKHIEGSTKHILFLYRSKIWTINTFMVQILDRYKNSIIADVTETLHKQKTKTNKFIGLACHSIGTL